MIEKKFFTVKEWKKFYNIQEVLCKKFDVPGYPTIIFKKGNDKMDYIGPRTIDGLEEQIKKFQ